MVWKTFNIIVLCVDTSIFHSMRMYIFFFSLFHVYINFLVFRSKITIVSIYGEIRTMYLRTFAKFYFGLGTVKN